MKHHDLGRHAGAAALILLTGGASACHAADEPTPAITANLSPSGEALKTIANSGVGEHITLTAGLSRVLTRQAFVVRDVDLPEQGLLVLGELPAQARPPALVTITGVVTIYHPEGLGEDSELADFRDRKIVVADTVRSWG